MDYVERKREEKILNRALCGRKENIKHPNIHKRYGTLMMEYEIGIYDVMIWFDDKQQLEFVHINGNAHTKLTKEKYMKEVNELKQYFIRNSKDKLRLLF